MTSEEIKSFLKIILPIVESVIESIPKDVIRQENFRDFLATFLEPILEFPPIDIRLKGLIVGRGSILSEYTNEEIDQEVMPFLIIGEIDPRMNIYIELFLEMEGRDLSTICLLYVGRDMNVTIENLWIDELPFWSSHSSPDWAEFMSRAEQILWIVFTVFVTKIIDYAFEKTLEKDEEKDESKEV